MKIIKLTNFLIFILSIISCYSTLININEFPLFVFSLLTILFYFIIFFFINFKYLKIKPLAIYINLISIIWIGIRVSYLNFRYDSINYKYLTNFNKYDLCVSLLLCILLSIRL